jgi:hypothetical protein
MTCWEVGGKAQTQITRRNGETTPCRESTLAAERNLFHFAHSPAAILRTDSDSHSHRAVSILEQTAFHRVSSVGNTYCAQDARKASDAAHG